jgi:Uma2 family endonuclease
MATTHDPKAGSAQAGAARRATGGSRRVRWTREQFHRMADAGFFGDRHVELIGGELFEMVTNPPHETAVGLAVRAATLAFGPNFLVRDQKTLDLGRRYQPLPDVTVVTGDLRDYAAAHPKTALLVIEVSDSSLRQDRRVKAHRYAAAGLPDYWIVNLVDRQLEVHRDPGPDPARKGHFRYSNVTIIPATGHASPLHAPTAAIAVADLLP